MKVSDKERKVLEKYLSRYAEKESTGVSRLIFPHSFHSAMVLPCYDEPVVDVHQLISQTAVERTLFILVINVPEDASASPLENTTALLRSFDSMPLLSSTIVDISSNPAGLPVNAGQYPVYGVQLSLRVLVGEANFEGTNAVLLVDRVSCLRIPPKEGVGLARKIGADIAAALFACGIIENSWLANTDADACLSQHYFSIVHQLNAYTGNYAAAVFPFEHHCHDQALQGASTLYDLSLRYYVDALRWCQSPYAYATIGSCIAFNLLAYAQVRGFPKRAGGEDFYLLNKLCKLKLRWVCEPRPRVAAEMEEMEEMESPMTCCVISGVKELPEPIIRLQARESHRVPFGTGPAISKIKYSNNPLQSYYYYHPRIFLLLRCWIQTMNLLWDRGGDEVKVGIETEIETCWQSTWNAVVDDLPADAQITDEEQLSLTAYAKQVGWYGAIAHSALHSRSAAAFSVQLHTWFDGFRTLKFIHFFRESLYPSQPYQLTLVEGHRLPFEFDGNVLGEFKKKLYDFNP